MNPLRIAVIGGGIAGLTAAYRLAQARRSGAPVEEYLFEAQNRLGGALCTEFVEGCTVEAGADSFLTEKPEAADLCFELALGDQLVGSRNARRRTWILHRDRLASLPEGFEFMIPSQIGALARTPLLSLRDKLRAAGEVFYRRPAPRSEESVAEFFERHFGKGVGEKIADPLLSAVYGGEAARLSAAAVIPRLVEMDQAGGSLIRQLGKIARRKRQASSAQDERLPIFTTLRDGLELLPRSLAAKLDPQRVHLSCPVRATTRGTGRGYRVTTQDTGREPLEVAGVILALPAWVSARLLHPIDAELGATLEEIPYSSSLIVALGYERSAAGCLPEGYGFLVPGKERPRLLACTFVDQKFPHRAPPERRLLRCFLGGTRDEAALDLDDQEAVMTVRRDLQQVIGLEAEPLFARVYRWPRAMAQYVVGHRERLAKIRERTAAFPGLFLCGNAYEGIGVPDCIRSGRRAAEECLRRLVAGV